MLDVDRWWQVFRRIVIFWLGVAVIIDSIRDNKIAELGAGLILIGVLPLDDFMRLAMRHTWRDRGDDAETSQRSRTPPGSEG